MTADERGSILPLLLGWFAIVAVALVLTIESTSLHAARAALDQVADAAAVAAADGFRIQRDGAGVVATLTPDDARQAARELVHFAGARLVTVHVADGRSAHVTVGATWHPVVASVFLPAGVELTSSATARTALE